MTTPNNDIKEEVMENFRDFDMKSLDSLSRTTLEAKFDMSELDMDSDDEYYHLEGYISTIDSDREGDIVERKAYNRTMYMMENMGHEVPVLYNHNQSEPIGMPYKMEIREKGMYAFFRLPKADKLVSERLIHQIKVGSLRSLSIGACIIDAEETEYGLLIKDMLIFEFSLTPIPANKEAKITKIKSINIDSVNLSNIIKEGQIKSLEKDLRKGVKFSRESATLFCSLIMKGAALNQSESGEEDQSDSEAKLKLEELEKKCKSALNDIIKKLED